MEPVTCHIYKTSKKAELYLYTLIEDDFSMIPEDILRYFGTPEKAMEIELTAERKLARVNVDEVLKSLDKNGFFIQMPPSTIEKVTD
jgi:hypothetical protein